MYKYIILRYSVYAQLKKKATSTRAGLQIHAGEYTRSGNYYKIQIGVWTQYQSCSKTQRQHTFLSQCRTRGIAKGGFGEGMVATHPLKMFGPPASSPIKFAMSRRTKYKTGRYTSL